MWQHDAYDDDDGPGRMRDDTSRKRKHDDVWRPNQTTGKLGKQPKPPKSPSSSQPSKPKPVAGASADGSPYRPPLRRCVVSSKAVRAMQTAVDAPLPPGLLQESDVHLSSSAPDLAYLEKRAAENAALMDGGGGGHNLRMCAPPTVPGGGPHARTRMSLPVYRHRDALIDAFKNNPVTIVEGETGSGKTTQVAQYLLEHAAETGTPVNIVCTQPRRISAIGVAERVASERGEPRVGVGAVGYAIRGESKTCDNTRLLFCTTGVLLRRLERDPGLHGVTHVLVDEVHERTVEGDFLLMALKEMLGRRANERREGGGSFEEKAEKSDGDDDDAPERAPSLGSLKPVPKSLKAAAASAASATTTVKLGLMSATMDGDVLAKYFDDAPRVSFPGRAYPVATLHLEDALSVTNHWVDRQAEWCHGSREHQRRAGKAASKDESNRPPSEGEWLQRLTRSSRNQHRARAACRALAQLDENVVNVQLISELVRWFVVDAEGDVDHALAKLPNARDDRWDKGMADNDRGMDGAAILVFLPGTKEIDAVKEALGMLARRLHGGGGGADARRGRFVLDPDWILPLHGSLPPDDQRKVFLRPPPGVCKVVLSTNVAETSITIDDVTCVIDTGRVKEERYDAERLMSSLDDVMVSHAAAKQRRGRAGRVRPGIAFHLFTSDAPLARYTDPEVRRVGLQQLVMRVKALNLEGDAEAVCSRLPEPPEKVAVHNAVEDLRCIGALTAGACESLTPLGRLLAQLPTDARLGKLVVYGCALGLADEAITLASLLGSRSPFMMPAEAREAADESKRKFGEGPQSDVLGALQAYNEFDAIAGESRFSFARDRFLSIKTLQQVANSKRQLLENLSTLGIVPRGIRANHAEYVGRKYDGTDGVRLVLGQTSTAQAADGGGGGGGEHFVPAGLLAGLLCAGLYPQLAYLHAPPTKKGAASASAVKLHVRPADRDASEPDAASVHPSSVNSKLDGNAWRSCYVAFHERVKTSKVYTRDSTPVPPLAMMVLAGGDLKVENGGGPDGSLRYETGGDGYDDMLVLDGQIRLHAPRPACDAVVELRERVQALVRRLVNNAGDERRGKAKDIFPRFDRNVIGPAPMSTGDLQGETVVRDMVAALAGVCDERDVAVAPELSAAERKKMENQRRHAAKVAAQREAKARAQGARQARGGGGGGGRRRRRRRAR